VAKARSHADIIDKKGYDTSRGGCIHCHMIHTGELQSLRKEGQRWSDKLLWYYPIPDAVGLEMDIDQMATIGAVKANSVAEQSGFLVGDRILKLAGQPLISIADLQWVVHNAEVPARLMAEVQRDGKVLSLALPLEPGWRRVQDFTWRNHIWYLRQHIAGFSAKPITLAERKKFGIEGNINAFRITSFPPSWVKNRNRVASEVLAKEDIILAVDDQSQPLRTESQFLAYLASRVAGEQVQLTVVRAGEKQTVHLTIQ